MTDSEHVLFGGKTYSVKGLLTIYINELYSQEVPTSGYCVYVMLSSSLDRLVFQIWDAENETKLEIDGNNTFVFNLSQNPDSQEECYEYRPAERYGSIDDETCERYDELGIYSAIKHLSLDLIKSSKK